MTASFGLSILGGDETDISAAMKRADNGLYRAKAAGRNQVVSSNAPTGVLGAEVAA